MSTTTKTITAIIALALIIGGVWYFGGGEKAQKKEPIKIGLISPLTGEAASWGQNALAGIKLAVKEINEEGGINKRRIELITENGKCDPNQAINAENKLINVNKVSGQFVVCASSAGAVLPIAQKNHIPTILVLASSPHFTKIGDYIFRTYPSDALQAKYAAEFIKSKMQINKVAMISVQNESGEGMKKVFEKEFEKEGGDIVYQSSVAPSEKDSRTQLTKIKNSDAEILYSPVYPANAISLLQQTKEFDLEMPVMGYAPFRGQEVVESDVANGVMFTQPKLNSPKQLRNRIKSLSDFKDLKILPAAAVAYDAATVMFSAMQEAGVNEKQIRKKLANTHLEGVSSPLIEFDDTGDLRNTEFEVKVIKDKKVVPYNTAEQ